MVKVYLNLEIYVNLEMYTIRKPRDLFPKIIGALAPNLNMNDR
jgi:hypothetical protein